MNRLAPVVVIAMLMLIVGDARADGGPDQAAIIAAPAALGPAPSIEAACQLSARGEGESDQQFCSIDKTSKAARRLKKVRLAAPYQQLALVDRDGDDEAAARLAIRTGDRWYLATLATWTTEGASHGGYDLTSIAIKDVIPGGGPEILIVGRHDALRESHDYHTFGSSHDALWVCSLGASGAPSCAEVPLGERRMQHDMSSLKNWRFRLAYKFDRAGRISRTVKGTWPSDRRRDEGEELSDVTPRHSYENTRTLLFP